MTSQDLQAFIPYVLDISGKIVPEDAFRRLAQRRTCAFLDSARQSTELGRYSFLAVEPFAVVVDQGGADGPRQLHDQLKAFHTTAVEGLPPFQGGAIVFWSYDLSKNLEQLPASRWDEFRMPRFVAALYDVVLAFDHQYGRAWLISQGFPEIEPSRRERRARERADACLSWLLAPIPRWEWTDSRTALAELSPWFPTPIRDVYSNFSAEAYMHTVQRAIDYVYAGDVFQVNLAQRLLCRAAVASPALYLSLRRHNAAPFAGYFDLGDHQIVSASPERFLCVKDRYVEARPIKGTRQRTTRPEADLFSGAELLASAKDLSENVMIVDLMRNDLSAVCEDDSIRVTQLCGLEHYEYVQHLVSVVRGRLRPEVSALAAVLASFPGGSITGAPKIRAMEIIAELEPHARNAYCGSLGYIGFDGNLDCNILIRTITASRGWWQFPVGGGIVAQSNPAEEYRETLVKAEGMCRAIRACFAGTGDFA